MEEILDKLVTAIHKEAGAFLASVTNDGKLGRLVRVPAEAVCNWAGGAYARGYRKGFSDGLAEQRKVQETANDLQRILDESHRLGEQEAKEERVKAFQEAAVKAASKDRTATLKGK
jgi:hypothetical protein